MHILVEHFYIKSTKNSLIRNQSLNDLQVNEGCSIASLLLSLIFHDFGDVLKDPFRYVHLFQLYTLLQKKTRQVYNGPRVAKLIAEIRK